MARWGVLGLVGIFVAGGFVALAAAGGVATVVERTGGEAFCTSCHYAQWPAASYRELGHFSNASGVRADCGDCHFDHSPWWRTLWQKASSSSAHILAHWGGALDTREVYEARREAMAETVWDHLEATDSGWCKNCHSFDAMALDAQSEHAAGAHQHAIDSGRTCIACHKGSGHGMRP